MPAAKSMSTPTVRFRPATPSDWPAIAGLLRENDLPLDGALSHLERFWIAQADEELVGVAGLEVYREVGLLRSVAVKRAFRGRGVGGSLVDHVLDSAAALHLDSVHLLTLDAGDYFARWGFQLKPIDAAPQELKASEELKGACPASALFLSLGLRRASQQRGASERAADP